MTKQRVGLIAAAVVVGLVAVSAVLMHREEPKAVSLPEAGVPPPASSVAAASQPTAGNVAAATQRRNVGKTAAAAPAAKPVTAACPQLDGNRAMQATPPAPDTRALRMATLTTMSASPDEIVRAAALVLGGDMDLLARAAAYTHDARVYALAFHNCRRRGADALGACQMLSARQWARLDPDNAAAWLFVAAEARNQPGSVDEAMSRVAQARRNETYAGLATSLVFDHASQREEDQPLVAQIGIELIGSEAAWTMPGLLPLRNHCRPERLIDSNRRQECSDIAAVLAEKSTSLLDQGMGLRIGEFVGWPAERVRALKAEQEAVRALMMTRVDVFRGCSGPREQLSAMVELARLGEVAANRRAIERSGKTVQQLAEVFRLAQERARSAAAKAAASSP